MNNHKTIPSADRLVDAVFGKSRRGELKKAKQNKLSVPSGVVSATDIFAERLSNHFNHKGVK